MKKPFRINIIGAPGSGKSFLAEQLFLYFKQKNQYSVEFVPEWIRSEIYRIGPMESLWEQIRTSHKQREMEQKPKSDIIITDSGTTAGYFYACLHFNGDDKRQLAVIEDLYADLLSDIYNNYYDVTIYAPPIINDFEDAARYHNKNEIQSLDQHMKVIFTVTHKYGNVLSLPQDINTRFNICVDFINKILEGNNNVTK